MKRLMLVTCCLVGCAAETGGGGSISAPEPVVSIGRHSEPPRGNLLVDEDGIWMFTSEDACKFVQGRYDAAKLKQIQQWAADESLRAFRTTSGGCPEDKYMTGADSQFMCLDDAVTSESGKSLIQLYHESAAAIMWDGVERDCKGKGEGPGGLMVSPDADNSDPLPPAR